MATLNDVERRGPVRARAGHDADIRDRVGNRRDAEVVPAADVHLPTVPRPAGSRTRRRQAPSGAARHVRHGEPDGPGDGRAPAVCRDRHRGWSWQKLVGAATPEVEPTNDPGAAGCRRPSRSRRPTRSRNARRPGSPDRAATRRARAGAAPAGRTGRSTHPCALERADPDTSMPLIGRAASIGPPLKPSESSTAMPPGLTVSAQSLSRGKASRSATSTRTPARARTSAAIDPAGPAPATMTSYIWRFGARALYLSSRGPLFLSGSAGAFLFAGSMAYFWWWYVAPFGVEASIVPSAGAGRVWPPLVWNVATFSVFALHHSALARSGLKAAVSRRRCHRISKATVCTSGSERALL